MAGPSSAMVIDSALSTTAKEANRNNRIQQFSGTLIKLLKVPLGHQTPLASSTSYVDNLRDDSLRKPSSCWVCKRLLACLSNNLCGEDTTFILRSSTSNCALNHDLLILTRIFLKSKNISPDVITVESASVGPLRLILVVKRLSPWKQGSKLMVRNSELTNNADLMYTVRPYDIYQVPDIKRFSATEVRIPKMPHIPRNSHSVECLRLAKAWFHDCLLEHPRCRQYLIPQLPRRVIDVEQGQLRLLVPEHGTRGHWAALSHCWGKTNALKTTLKTIESHKRGIDWESLPKTFKDAVEVTRALNLRYLWIDSLCIIQDDGRVNASQRGVDFHAEAATMCDIYRDSIVTIAASSSASDSAGFLQDRKVDDPVELNKPERLSSLHVRQAIDHSRMIRNDPIHARAWTFQETVLPRRLLSFGSYEATWECETDRQCECRQIEYGIDARTSANELGRAAYRQYTRRAVEHTGNKYDPLGRGAHLRTCATGSSSSQSLAGERYANQLLDHKPALKDRETYRQYIKMVLSTTLFTAINTFYSTTTERDRTAESNSYSLEKFGLDCPLACAEGPKYAYVSTADCVKGPPTAPEEHAYGLKPQPLGLKPKPLSTAAVNTFYRYWRRVLVPEYTRRALSKDSDRLVALQAIASDANSLIGNPYLAGLWQGDLINQLCWQSASARNLPADNESPSWSWSSIRGPIVPHLSEQFEKSDFDSECGMIVVSVKCSLASENRYGRILDGSIIVHASAMEVRCVKNQDTGLFNFHPLISSMSQPESKSSVPINMEFSPDTSLYCQPEPQSRSVERGHLNNMHRGPVMRALLLFVKFAETRDFCVLVCGRVSGAPEPNTCRRLGIGTVDQSSVDLFFSRSFKERFVLI